MVHEKARVAHQQLVADAGAVVGLLHHDGAIARPFQQCVRGCHGFDLASADPADGDPDSSCGGKRSKVGLVVADLASSLREEGSSGKLGADTYRVSEPRYRRRRPQGEDLVDCSRSRWPERRPDLSYQIGVFERRRIEDLVAPRSSRSDGDGQFVARNAGVGEGVLEESGVRLAAQYDQVSRVSEPEDALGPGPHVRAFADRRVDVVADQDSHGVPNSAEIALN
ncbi:hypothetical protein LR394_33370 [Kineosporia babensis]|uniref:Uncharacterized protein n=1 Tax=Kineosporia babensis TaxID=499548 RepID=A0A9X1NLA0_9ACTN|nr:hypothetical protein [Kineosporia babensis]MCD5315796.1 hypothetical protein [Kineosporia babensis]